MSTDTLCSTDVDEDDVTTQVPSDIHPSTTTSDDITSFVCTDTPKYRSVTKNDVTDQAPSDIFPSRATSGDIESSILSNTVCLSHVANDA